MSAKCALFYYSLPVKLFENSFFLSVFIFLGFFKFFLKFFKRYLLHLEQSNYQAIQKFVCQISAYIEKSAEKSAASLPESESGSAFDILKSALMLVMRVNLKTPKFCHF